MLRLVLSLVLLVPAIGRTEPLLIFTSVPPLQAIVEDLGGRHVDVRSMVRPGYNPHTYEPTPRQISALAKAQIYIRAGVPFEDAWMDRLLAANPQMQLLDTQADIDLHRSPSHTDPGHEHHASDPHVWTSPLLVRGMAGIIREKLIELDPGHAADYRRLHGAFMRKLDALDAEIRALLGPLRGRSFMVFHPAWGHFSETYGLIQMPIEHDGKAPGARALAALIDRAKAEGVKVIFVQPQFDRRHAAGVARAIGGRVAVADPLAYDYVGNLLRVARELEGAMQP